jgi:hypothetical protein
LVDHIETLLVREGFSEVSGEAPDLGLFPGTVGRGVRDKLVALTKAFPTIDVIFVHRDADGDGMDARIKEIQAACDGVVELDKVIPVVPVTMLETWLLADVGALKRVAGNSGLQGAIACHPGVRRLESVRDSKDLLLSALCEASEAQGTRLRRFKKRFSEMRARLAHDLDPDGPVMNLPSYKQFRERLSGFSKNYAAKWDPAKRGVAN